MARLSLLRFFSFLQEYCFKRKARIFVIFWRNRRDGRKVRFGWSQFREKFLTGERFLSMYFIEGFQHIRLAPSISN